MNFQQNFHFGHEIDQQRFTLQPVLSSYLIISSIPLYTYFGSDNNFIKWNIKSFVKILKTSNRVESSPDQFNFQSFVVNVRWNPIKNIDNDAVLIRIYVAFLVVFVYTHASSQTRSTTKRKKKKKNRESTKLNKWETTNSQLSSPSTTYFFLIYKCVVYTCLNLTNKSRK